MEPTIEASWVLTFEDDLGIPVFSCRFRGSIPPKRMA